MTDPTDRAAAVIDAGKARGRTIAVAESCTGGLLGAALTNPPGASAVFLAGFVTYANAAKVALLGVDPALIDVHGAVSAEIAAAMAQGARIRGGADLAVSITGVAGPDGGSALKPVGLVWFGVADARAVATEHRLFEGLDRAGVRAAAVATALDLLMVRLAAEGSDDR